MHSITKITPADDLGGMEYPFLTQFPDWVIYTYPLDAVPAPANQTLRWVKGDKVSDLHILGTNTEQFLYAMGLKLDVARKGPFVLSKRISRIMRPYRFYEFRRCNQVSIDFATDISNAEWDGCALISRTYLDGMARRYSATHAGQPEHQIASHLREIETCQRWEITIIHADGQEKGHALVVDDLAVDFLIPAGATKRELALDGRVFIGLQPVHSHDHMRLDVQSLINLFPFFSVEKLLVWLAQEAELFLDRIKTGQLDVLLSRIENIQSDEQLAQLQKWYIGEYIASGGKLMWFPATVKAMGRQFLRRLNHGRENFRFPIPGGRFYIFPASVGQRDVPEGHIEIDAQTATAWVNQTDWNNHIVQVLGGADGDDALWIHQFTDYDGSKRVLAWRSPNQLGEYVLFQPTDNCYTIPWQISSTTVTWPHMDSRKLPARIDTLNYTYGELIPFPQFHAEQYSIAAMEPAISNALTNGGMLGAYCNALMVLKATYGDVPLELPARLEDVIDGSVKAPVDLRPVADWIRLAMRDIAADQYAALPAELSPRIEPALDADTMKAVQINPNHWFSSLMRQAESRIDIFMLELNNLAGEATPPLDIFKHGTAWQTEGQTLVALYQHALRSSGLDAANNAALDHVVKNNQVETLLGAAAHVYNRSLSDALLWQPDPKVPGGAAGPRRPGLARLFLNALRHIGIIGEPIWLGSAGTLLHFDQKPTGVPVQLNGVWFNWLKVRDGLYATMSDVPKDIRTQAKKLVAERTADFVGLTISTEITDDGRIVARGPSGHTLAYIQTGQEIRVMAESRWTISQAQAKDGNLYTVLCQA
ncbi:MAG: hypothetical protein IPM39_25060 [Chloroflexi bacterium]|nr:hypothetical protein [Chloroflexota bacterium]